MSAVHAAASFNRTDRSGMASLLVGPGAVWRRGRWKVKIAYSHRQVGLRPKTAARLIRFEGVLGRLAEGRPLDWGQLAREVGYADQAHLIREFHQFTGMTPTAFVARTTRPGGDGARQGNFVQDRVTAAS